MIGNILDNTTELSMIKYTFGEIFSSGGATLYKNPSDQTVMIPSLNSKKLIKHPWLKWYQLQKSNSRTTTMLRSSIGPIGYLGAYGAVAYKKCIIPKSAVCLENTF